MRKIQALILSSHKDRLSRAVGHYSQFVDRITVCDASLNGHIRNTGWINDHESDWVLVVDDNELVEFPNGVQETLAAYDEARLKIARAIGFDELTGPLQYTLKKNPWLDKPVLFSPRRIMSINFSPCGSTCLAMDIDKNAVTCPLLTAEPEIHLIRKPVIK